MPRIAWITSACLLAVPAPGGDKALSPAPPLASEPWTNSLGMPFLPVPGTRVLFSLWETRVQDWTAFVAAESHETGDSMYVAGTNGWELRRGCNWRHPGFDQGPAHPVVGVNWDDAQAFCQWLTKTERDTGWIPRTRRYRLPTDTEWSRAVGLANEPGGTPQARFLAIRDIFPWGTQWPPPPGAGNFAPALGADPIHRTAPTGSFPANRLGLVDLAGNVSEWCEDWWNDDRKFRVLRGASWNNDCRLCLMSSYRFPNLPTMRIDYYGFRVVLQVEESTP